MARTTLFLAFLIMTAVGASGCATPALLKHMDVQESGENVAAHATSAWRYKDGDVVVCVTGWTAKRKRTSKPKSFSFRMTFAQPETPEGDPEFGEPASEPLWGLAAYPVPKDTIKGSCPRKPGSAMEVPVVRVPAADAGEGAIPERPPWNQSTLVDLNRADPVLYSFDHPEDPERATLVYQHETPLPGGSRVVRIDLPTETVYPNSKSVVLLPNTVAVDVVIGVVVVVAVILDAASKS